MPGLGPAHKGYAYQDIVTAYFLARGLVERIEAITIDHKLHPDDRFDDLLIVFANGHRVRRQFKHSESSVSFVRSDLSGDSHGLRLDRLVHSWRQDVSCRTKADEYRVCVTWGIASDWREAGLLLATESPVSFRGGGKCFRLDAERIWPARRKPSLACLERTSRRDFLSFSKHFVLELECPAASRDLEHPGALECLLLEVLGDRVGFGRYPNEHLSPLDATARLILMASFARSATDGQSSLTPQQIATRLGLVIDFGRLPQEFPFWQDRFVSRSELRTQLMKRVRAGGITVLEGAPGAGKSWELTALAKQLRGRGMVVACHYCYLEPGDPRVQSRITLNAFYGNLIAEIIDAMPELKDEKETRYSSGPKELQELLNLAAQMQPKKRLLVIVDGLDHIARVLREVRTITVNETQIARDILALKLPKTVSLIVGSQPGDHIAQIAAAGAVLPVPAWEEREVRAFLARLPMQAKLQTQRRRPYRAEGGAFVTELTRRSQGNALYCTYLCRELENRLEAQPAASAITFLRALPASDGKLATYYEFLLGGLEDGGRMVAEAMGLIDFGVTSSELEEIFPLLHGWLDQFLRQLSPILEQTQGRGGLRIYHESFRRHILDQTRGKPGSLSAKLKDVIAWLEGRGFMTDSRAYRFLFPNLVRAERAGEVLAKISHDFVVRSVIEGQPSRAIDANLSLFANLAADAQNFPLLVRTAELVRAWSTCGDNLNALEYGTTFAALNGAERLAERLTFDGAATMNGADGLLLCSLCADAGVNPPWQTYVSQEPPDEDNGRPTNMKAELARFHGLVSSGKGAALRKRLVSWLSKTKEDIDEDYLQGVVRRWAEVTGADDLPRLRKESKCSQVVAEALDLEFARRTKNLRLRRTTATRVGRLTNNSLHALETLRLGATPTCVARFTDTLQSHDIGLKGRRSVEAESVRQWVAAIRMTAFTQPELLAAEKIRVRGEGWYRSWLTFVVMLAGIERRALRKVGEAADEVVDAIRALAVDVEPFRGEPRACDLFNIHGVIHDTVQIALRLLRTSAQWRDAMQALRRICEKTTTSLDHTRTGPLTFLSLTKLVTPYAERADLHEIIRSELEPILANEHLANLYTASASDEMGFAALLMKMGERAGAEAHWKMACRYLCAYGMRKDRTIYEVLDNVRALQRAGTEHVMARLTRLLPMVYAVVLHTDGRETRYAISQWFRELVATDASVAAWLLGRSMVDDGGSMDYRIEEGLEHWLSATEGVSGVYRRRLEKIVDGPGDPQEVSSRIRQLSDIPANAPLDAGAELQLLAATVHGDGLALPKESYTLLREQAPALSTQLPEGVPDISYPERREDHFHREREEEVEKPALGWPAPVSPVDLLRQLQGALDDSTITNQQLAVHAQPFFDAWADTHRDDLGDILTEIARANRFGDRAGLLAELGAGLADAGKNGLAARALTMAFAGHRGGGGYLTFGDEEQDELLTRALRACRATALSTLAKEMAKRAGALGVTLHLTSFFGRKDDVALATAMWDEACTAIAYRLPGYEEAQGPFLPLEAEGCPRWSRDDAALFLILARISHPEKRRKTAALCQAAWMVQHEGARCATAFRELWKASACFTHQLWSVHLIAQFEPEPFALSRALAPELNILVASGRIGLELLAKHLLTRAGSAVTGRAARHQPVITVQSTPDEQRRVLSLDDDEVVDRIANIWEEFPQLVAARFETVMRSSDSHESRIRARWEAMHAISRTTFPLAALHRWEKEVFLECLHEIIPGLETHLWSKGEWNDRIWPTVLTWLLPDLELPARHAFSRRVRPSWPLPEKTDGGPTIIVTVPDGELCGWVRIGYHETYLDCGDSSLNEIQTKTRVVGGVALMQEVAALPDSGIALTYAHKQAWIEPFARTQSLKGFKGPLASVDAFGEQLARHTFLGVSPRLLASLGLRPRTGIGSLDLFDAEGELAIAYRWWACRPLGDHRFPEEHPRLSGGALLMRPDLFNAIKSVTGLHANEHIDISGD